MSYEAQDNAIRNRFATEWGATTPVAYENVEFSPPDNAAWVRLHVADAGAANASFGDPGNNVKRHAGLVTVMIFTPLNRGDKQALELADDVVAIFQGWQDATARIRVVEPPFVRRIGAENKWYHLQVRVAFIRDAFA